MLDTRTPQDEEPERAAQFVGIDSGPASVAQGPPSEHTSREQQFTSSPRGACLARRFAVQCLDEWGYPPLSDTSATVALLVAELAANAVRHGRVRGRDFHLRLAFGTDVSTIRIEVSDACPQRPSSTVRVPAADDESGRGLLLVALMSTRWGSIARHPLGKIVWAEVATDAARRP